MNARTIGFNKLAYLEGLKSAGVSEEIARAHADGLDQTLRESVATKSDLEKTETSLRSEITALRSNLQNVETKLDAKIDTTAAVLRAEIERSKSSILMWPIGFLFFSLTLLSFYTALKTDGILH